MVCQAHGQVAIVVSKDLLYHIASGLGSISIGCDGFPGFVQADFHQVITPTGFCFQTDFKTGCPASWDGLLRGAGAIHPDVCAKICAGRESVVE